MENIKKYWMVYFLVTVTAVLFALTRLLPEGSKLLKSDQVIQIKSSGEFQSASPAADNKQAVSVTVDFGNGQVQNYSDIKAENAYTALVTAVKKDNLEVKVKHYDFGDLVESIGDKGNTKDLAWIYYVNGVSGDVAADKKELKAGDKVEWKYEKPKF